MPPLPPPLPPAERTVGQLVAESIRLYGRRFWPSLALGLAPATVDIVASNLERSAALAFASAGGALLLTPAYIGAVALAAELRPTRRSFATAYAVGALVFLPFPILASLFVLPGLAWLALFGLAVPAALVERLRFRDALARARRLAFADYLHALGSLATLAIVAFLTRFMLALLLRGQGDQTEAVAAFLADVVISPLLFLGTALLYFDQAARVSDSGSAKRAGPKARVKRRSRADLHPADHPDGAGRPDAQVEP